MLLHPAQNDPKKSPLAIGPKNKSETFNFFLF